MLPRDIFENLHVAMAILVLFKYVITLCLNSLTLFLRASPNMLNFVRTFLIMRA